MPKADPVALYAALGDPTRLTLVMRLARESSLSISALAHGSDISRQGLTKHLHVLEGCGLIRSERVGRETQFKLVPEALREAGSFLDQVGALWDARLDRLKRFAEKA